MMDFDIKIDAERFCSLKNRADASKIYKAEVDKLREEVQVLNEKLEAASVDLDRAQDEIARLEDISNSKREPLTTPSGLPVMPRDLVVVFEQGEKALHLIDAPNLATPTWETLEAIVRGFVEHVAKYFTTPTSTATTAEN